MKMNPRQTQFCHEYMIDFNGTQAAIRSGYSPGTAAEMAAQNLMKPHIKRYINKLKAELRKKTGVTAEMIIDEFKKIGFSNIQDYLQETNSIADISKISKKKAAAVSGISITETVFGTGEMQTTKTRVDFKLYDKVKALENLGRHLGIFEADNKQASQKITIRVKTSE